MRFKANRGVAIGVENLGKARKFYEETFGLDSWRRVLGELCTTRGT